MCALINIRQKHAMIYVQQQQGMHFECFRQRAINFKA